MLTRIARSSYRHRRAVLAIWLVALALAIVGGSALAGEYATSGRLPHTDSQRAYDQLAKDFPQRHGDEGQIVFADVRHDRPAIDAYLATVAKAPGVIEVEPLRISKGGLVAVAPITTASGSGAHPQATANHIKDLAKPLQHQGVDVQFSGNWFGDTSMPASEIVGILAAIIVLLVAFGSLIAMGLPIVTALVGIGISLAGVGIIANVFTTPDFASQVAAMIGIGVGIDYALFIVTRYRNALHRTGSPEAAVIEAMNTSGRAVVFAGFTVMVSVLGIFLMGLPFLHGLAVGISLAVVIAMLAAITLLPALLGFVGFTIDRFRVGRHTSSGKETMWHRWARTVQRRPLPIALAGLAVLVLLALPTLGLHLGNADASNDPKGSTTHRAYDLISEGFGPGANGPILIVVDTSTPGSARSLPQLVNTLRATPGVASVTDARPNAAHSAAMATLYPTTEPQDRATEHLVHRLRDNVIPGAIANTGLQVHVGGQTASSVDFADVIGRRLPIFIGAVLALSFLLLLAVFRSLLVPLKAVLMNLLSIGAAYGIIVATFQWGWGSSLLGVSAAPIEPWVPMMLFAIVFGLSMDYEVFLLSAVREHYDETGDNGSAVAEGLAGTARVITAAALIMVFVFGSFVVSDVRALKLIGLGLAIAVALDASIVRVVLVPATMELLGDANWWLPRWLQRAVPRLRVEDRSIEAELERIRQEELTSADH
jgi:putative drug exporter of the RND superfamily